MWIKNSFSQKNLSTEVEFVIRYMKVLEMHSPNPYAANLLSLGHKINSTRVDMTGDVVYVTFFEINFDSVIFNQV